MAWVWLILAGLGEVVGVTGLNLLNKRRDTRSFLIMILGFAASFMLLSMAMKSLSMGTAYAVWTAIGSVGATLIGMIFYGESRQLRRIFFLALVISAAVGLKLLGH
ncbi:MULTISPECIES: DMT family transporter [Cohnella]|jgi:paired small multidrug resistance pump|uniref:DMT family transporter n=1 Tax=Cohnella TaxID=329857 RepID=UPI00035FD313|nr:MULTISPECIES: multidrug efflux SMR transporter [Cohnella]REK66430.1 MAG: QacE family quaternary ammonium compound efflux SMR transporter [Cohnella sp.]